MLQQAAVNHQYEESSSDEDDGGGGGDAGYGNEDGVMETDGVMDLEDLGKVMHKMKAAKNRRDEEERSVTKGSINSSGDGKEVREPREMVTPLLRQSLTKQGKLSSMLYDLMGKWQIVWKKIVILAENVEKMGKQSFDCY